MGHVWCVTRESTTSQIGALTEMFTYRPLQPSKLSADLYYRSWGQFLPNTEPPTPQNLQSTHSLLSVCKCNPLPCTLYRYSSISPRMRAQGVTISPPSLDSTLRANREGSRQKHRPGWWGEVGAPPGRRARCAEGLRLDPQDGNTAGNRTEGGGKEPQDFSGLEGKWGLRRKPGRGPGSGRT